MRFIIENNTDYSSRHLRSFVTRAYAVAYEFGGVRARNYAAFRTHMNIRFARSNWRGESGSTGHGYYDGRLAHIGVGDDVNPYDLAYVIAHEMAHCFGMRHSEMSGGALMTHDMEVMKRFYPWAGELPLEKIQPKKFSAGERAAYKREAIEQRLIRWESKLRRAENAVKRLRLKLREIDRRIERKAAKP